MNDLQPIDMKATTNGAEIGANPVPNTNQPPAPGELADIGGLMSAAATYLSRIDWQKVFVFAARSMAAAAVAFLTFQFCRYFQYFGAGALAMSGQFAIGVFFLAV
ncbi:hypothetical protein VSS37_07285, partial [Candidatus Thiothrix sp. Deng01]